MSLYVYISDCFFLWCGRARDDGPGGARYIFNKSCAKIKKCQHLGVSPLCDKMSVGEKIGKKVGENFVGKEKMPTFAAESETPGEVGEWLKPAVC